ERADVEKITDGYRRYREEFDRLRTQAGADRPRPDYQKLADANPVRHVTDPCHDLLRANEDMMSATSAQSDGVSRQLSLAMLLLGLGGPASGLIIGYGMARGLSRSIYQLSFRVQDMAQRLDAPPPAPLTLDVASVSIAGDGDLQSLDRQLQHVV